MKLEVQKWQKLKYFKVDYKEMEIGEVTTIGIEEKNRVIWLGSHITQLIRPVWVSLGKHGEVVET